MAIRFFPSQDELDEDGHQKHLSPASRSVTPYPHSPLPLSCVSDVSLLPIYFIFLFFHSSVWGKIPRALIGSKQYTRFPFFHFELPMIKQVCFFLLIVVTLRTQTKGFRVWNGALA